MKANDICFVRECIRDGYGVEDIANMSLLTLAQIRSEVREMRALGVFSSGFFKTPTPTISE